MKILKLTLKNINSLHNEQMIDFTAPPLANSGIFAIIGETGSGKTTILDAITLALYNEVARGCDVKQVLSYGKTDAFSIVEFSVKGDVYKASWAIKRARKKADGNIQPVIWQFSAIKKGKEEIIAEKQKDVKTKLFEITGGLDKDKFLQSVMLAQGNFAAFLKADANTRGELLEKITGKTDYSSLSIAAYQKHSEEKLKYDQLVLQLGSEPLLSEEELTELHAQLNNYKDKITAKEAEDKSLITQKNWLESIQNTNHKIEQAKKEQQISIQTKEQNQFLSIAINLHEKTIPYAEDIGTLNKSIETIKKLTHKHEYINKDLSINKVDVSKAQKETEQTQKDLHIAKLQLIDAEPEIKTARELDSKIKTCFANLENANKELEATRTIFNNTQKELLANQTQLTEVESQLKKADEWLEGKKMYESIPSIISTVKEKSSTILTIEKEIHSHDLEIKTLKINLEKEQSDLDKLNSHKNKNEDVLEKTEKELSTLHSYYQKLTQGISKEELFQKMSDMEELGRSIHEMYDLTEKWHKNNSTLKDLGKRVHNQKELKISGDKELVLLESNQKSVQNNIKLLEEKRELELKIINFESERARLTDGKPCPLCGSESHPFAHTDLPQNSETSLNEIEVAKKDYESINDKIKKLIAEIPKQSDIDILEKDLTVTQDNQKGIINTYKSLAVHNTIDVSIEQNDLIKALLEEKRKEYQSLKKQNNEINELDKKVAEQEKSKHELKLEISKIASSIELLQEKHASYNQRITEKKAYIESEVKKLSEGIHEINKVINPFSLSVKEVSELETCIETLSKSYTTFEKALKKRDELTQTKSGLIPIINKNTAELETLQKTTLPEREEKQKEVQGQSDNLKQKRAEIFGGDPVEAIEEKIKAQIEDAEKKHLHCSNKLIEKQQEFSKNDSLQIEISNQIEEEQKREKAVLERILESAQGTFSSIEEILENRLADSEYREKKEQWETICKKVDAINTETETLEKHLKDLKSKKITDLSIEEIGTKEKFLSDEIKILREELHSVNLQLGKDTLVKQKNTELKNSIEIQGNNLKRWEMLNRLIGSAKGDKFRRFAQSITLRILAINANKHLNILSPRYSITLPKANIESLSFEITDSFQADNIRPMSTLSGGESFLVSLSLALGLSDMASGNNPVQSLFIDEGFGTLDPETLDIALSALDNLQASGKTIGVISHVEQLKERIQCQVRVKRKAGGVSKIEIYPKV